MKKLMREKAQFLYGQDNAHGGGNSLKLLQRFSRATDYGANAVRVFGGGASNSYGALGQTNEFGTNMLNHTLSYADTMAEADVSGELFNGQRGGRYLTTDGTEVFQPAYTSTSVWTNVRPSTYLFGWSW